MISSEHGPCRLDPVGGRDPIGRHDRRIVEVEGGRHGSGDAGFVAGLEALTFGVVVFVLGTLIIVNGWAVVDAKFATNGAAREAVRAVVETAGAATLSVTQRQEIARVAAQQAGAAHGYVGEAIRITSHGEASAWEQRCGAVRIEASIEVRPTILPGIVGPGTILVSSVHEEVVDPFRAGLAAREGLERLEGNACGF